MSAGGLRETVAAAWAGSRALRWGALGAAGLAVAGLLILGGLAWQDHREQRARQALAEAVLLLPAPVAPGVAPPSAEAREPAVLALAGVVAQYPGSVAAAQAGYRLGNLHYAAGRHVEARTAYVAALAGAPPGVVRALAALGVAYTWEAEGQWDRARTAYQALADDPSALHLKPEALAGLARSQEGLGDRAGALATWQRIRKEHPDGLPAGHVEHRIAGLESVAKP